MPELPEVETARLETEAVLKNHRLVEAEATADPIIFERCTPRMVTARLKGRKVKGSARRGKYFWLILDKAPHPVFHLGMSGYVEIFQPKQTFDKRWAKLILTTEKGVRVVFYDPRRFGRIRFAQDPLHEEPIASLGFEPLHDFPTAKRLHECLSKRRAPIKAVLLDQGLFAGVGNWIADEVLFQARLKPQRLASEISAAEVATLRKKLLSVIRTAVKARANYEKFPKGWLFQHRWGKRKHAETAHGHKIRHSTVGGRTTAWVEGWQK